MHRNHYVPVAGKWGELGEQMGAQKAPYMAAIKVDLTVHCHACGKACSKARQGERLTRQGVYCGKCYDEDKHGSLSSTVNFLATGTTNAMVDIGVKHGIY